MSENSEKKKVFISYAREDRETAWKLYNVIKEAGLIPWMDKPDLVTGQNWKFEISQAIRKSDYLIALLSSKSVSKRGFVQKEFNYALEVLGEILPGEIYIIPVRLDDCEVPYEKLHDIHWADLFPDYDAGLRDILRGLGIERPGNKPAIQPTKDAQTKPDTPVQENDSAKPKEKQPDEPLKEATNHVEAKAESVILENSVGSEAKTRQSEKKQKKKKIDSEQKKKPGIAKWKMVTLSLLLLCVFTYDVFQGPIKISAGTVIIIVIIAGVVFVIFAGILAAIAIPNFIAYRTRGYNSAANADIKDAYVAAQVCFIDYPDATITVMDLKQAGYHPSEDVILTVEDGKMRTLKMTSTHERGKKVYLIDWQGMIEMIDKMP